MRGRLIIVTLVLSHLVFSPYSYSQQKKHITFKKISDSLKITVEEIRYIGDDSYNIIIGFTNSSTNNLHINQKSLIVSIQTDVIGSSGWIKVKVSGNTEPDFLIKSNEKVRKSLVVDILPERYDNLYRTYEGDLSLKIESELLLRRGNDSKTDRKMEEIYLWLRPGTNKWIYREGM